MNIPHQDTVGHGFRGVGGFFRHVDAAVEPTDRPDGREPREEPSKTGGPGGQVIRVREDVFRGVKVVFSTDGEGDNSGGYEDKICAGGCQFITSYHE